jgi:hypothetical protein
MKFRGSEDRQLGKAKIKELLREFAAAGLSNFRAA